jgi:hypothetical protein
VRDARNRPDVTSSVSPIVDVRVRASAVAFVVAVTFYSLTGSMMLAWPAAPLTPSGLRLVDAVTALPVGDPVFRAARAAIAIGAIAMSLVAAIVARRVSSWTIAAGCAIAVAFEPSMWRRATTDPAGALAALFAVLALGALLAPRTTVRVRVVAAAGLLLPAVSLNPFAAAATFATAAGALLLAHVLATLPVRRAARAFLLSALLLVLAVDRVSASQPPLWRLIAWRDAVERALPPGTTIATGDRGTAAVVQVLFRERPSRIAAAVLPGAAGPATEFMLDDLRHAVDAAAGRVQRVPLTLADPAEILSRVPTGTIVGYAVSQVVAATRPSYLAAALGWIHRLAPAASATGFVTLGVAGRAYESVRETPSAMHVLVGDPIAGTDRRSPLDLEMSADETRVRIRFRGRDLIDGAAWGLILIDPRGPLLGAFAGHAPAAPIPMEVDGLEIWRLQAVHASP